MTDMAAADLERSANGEEGLDTLGSLLMAVVGAADVAIIVNWSGGSVGALGAVTAHCLAAALYFAGMVLLSRTALAQAVVLTVLLVLLGPVGSFALMIGKVSAKAAGSSALLRVSEQNWEHRVSSSEESLYDSLMEGRRPIGHVDAPRSFEAIFEQGDLDDQFAALAIIARSFRVEMRPALTQALASPVPALRVQAAAIYAKLRGRFSLQAQALLAIDPKRLSREQARTAARDCADVLDSKFLGDLQIVVLRSQRDAFEQVAGSDGNADGVETVTLRGAHRTPVPRMNLGAPQIKRDPLGGAA